MPDRRGATDPAGPGSGPGVGGPGITLGTAGHIDHGKTRLVGALTGTDTDRLAEERRRGISIELGFAELELPDGRTLGVVDVPGHERLVRTMVAGAGGIDMFLLVVAADDGVMPQTVEHLAALHSLGVEVGVVALNKIDVAEPATRALARAEIASLVPDAAIVEVSAARGDGIEQLRAAIAATAEAVAAERAGEPTWPETAGLLHVDRSFTIAGAGTVVTGTAAGSGFIAGAPVTVLPEGRRTRIRSIQVHGRGVAAAGGGRRVALNLAGLGRGEVPRGAVISAGEPGPQPSYRLDVRLLGGAAAAAGRLGRVQVHHGTRDVPARVIPLGGGLAQLRLEAPLVARARDRTVLRSIAPPGTIGGAEVIDSGPRRHGPGPDPDADLLRLLAEGEPAAIIAAAVRHGRELAADAGGWDADSPIAWALARFQLAGWQRGVADLLAAGRLRDERGTLRPAAAPASGSQAAAPPTLDETDARLLAMLESDGVEPRPPQTLADALDLPRADVVVRLAKLAAAGRLCRVSAAVWYPPERLDRLERIALALAARDGSVSLAGLRDALRASRKYSQAILEHLDRSGLTVRRGDEHLPRPSAAARASIVRQKRR